jgi:hypothetical protein
LHYGLQLFQHLGVHNCHHLQGEQGMRMILPNGSKVGLWSMMLLNGKGLCPNKCLEMEFGMDVKCDAIKWKGKLKLITLREQQQLLVLRILDYLQ